MNERDRLDGLEPISPELVLVDPELAVRVRALRLHLPLSPRYWASRSQPGSLAGPHSGSAQYQYWHNVVIGITRDQRPTRR
jgi:hypothetical protein